MSVWPEGYQSAAVVTVNFDGESFEQALLPNEPLWGRYSYGRYGAQIGIQRVLDALERHGLRATFFVPAWDVERYPDVMERIARAGHELAGRGYANEDFSQLNADQQQAVLEQSEEIFERSFGQKPRGWRAPGNSPTAGTRPALTSPGPVMSGDTRGILAERGYRYDSSFCDDDIPYVVTGSQGARLVEIPVFTTATDAFYYQAHRLPSVVAEAWREDLSAMHEAGGVFTLAISPRGDWGSGRGVRIQAIDDVLQAVHETPNVWLTTCDEIASWMLESATPEDIRPA